jgi:chromosome segregation ATPase
MEENSELIRLEQFIDKLLDKYKELRQNHDSLKVALAEKDNECSGLKERVAELGSERVVVGERVTSLIDRIEEWEIEQSYLDMDEDGDQGDQHNDSSKGHEDRF